MAVGKHSRRRAFSGQRYTAAFAVGATVCAVVASPVLANADEVDDLIAELDSISHDATAKVEEIKELEDEIASAQRRVDDLNHQADLARGDVERASGAREGFQRNVNGIAQSRYRNTQSELFLSTLESGSPQAAIDRAAYLGALARSAGRTIDNLNAASIDASQRSDAAHRAADEARRQREELDKKRGVLEREREELDKRVNEIEARVDGLGPEARARWVNKDNPVDTAGMVLSGAGNGVVSVALAQLGKPYGWGATGPNQFDCSGLMVYAYAQNGVAIPRTSQAQLAGGAPVALSDLQPGDIIGYFPGTTHVGMYIGNGMIVHSSDYGIPIQVVPYNSMPITGAVRY